MLWLVNTMHLLLVLRLVLLLLLLLLLLHVAVGEGDDAKPVAGSLSSDRIDVSAAAVVKPTSCRHRRVYTVVLAAGGRGSVAVLHPAVALDKNSVRNFHE